MHHIDEVQSWLRAVGLTGILVPSTDEYLSEFAPPSSRRLEWATGFKGSVGLAIILENAAALFVDGRYLRQATAELTGPIAVEAATSESRAAWLKSRIPPHARLALDPWLHSASEYEQWQALSRELGFELQLLARNPLDELWGSARPALYQPKLEDYPLAQAGQAHQSKCAALAEYVRAAALEAVFLSDAEDVSWLLNVRAAGDAIAVAVGEWHIVPSSASRVLVTRDGTVTWFVDAKRLDESLRLRDRRGVAIVSPDEVLSVLRAVASRGPIGLDLRRTPAILSTVIAAAGVLRQDETAARRRWRKHPAEIASARRVHIADGIAVVRLMAWLVRTIRDRTITEFEVAEKIEQLREEHPDYVGPSEPAMCAAGVSGAQPHYLPSRERCRRLNDHPIFWMDSGGQYRGGTTDNTIALALGVPRPDHVHAHTLVLKGFIALATARAPAGVQAFRLDALARSQLWRSGMDYPHGTGHGVGNFLNIHEGPLITRDAGPLASVPLEPGMIVSNEPGYYAPGEFGIRIESHMVVVESRYPGFIEFEIISRLPIDPRLVDFALLSPDERQWLADYHQTVLQDLGALLDDESAAWLRELVDSFAHHAR